MAIKSRSDYPFSVSPNRMASSRSSPDVKLSDKVDVGLNIIFRQDLGEDTLGIS